MRKSVVLVFALLVVVFLSLVVLAYSFAESSGKVSNSLYRIYTRAVCSGNTCQDYEFSCLNGSVISSRAISGFVTFGEDWVDNRDEKDLDKC